MTSYEDYLGMSAYGQLNYDNREIMDSWVANYQESPSSRAFDFTGSEGRLETTTDRAIRASVETVRTDLSKLATTIQRMKSMLPHPTTYRVSKGMSDLQLPELRNYLILSRMLVDRGVGQVTVVENPITPPEALQVIELIEGFNARPRDLVFANAEYVATLADYFGRTAGADGEAAISAMERNIPDFYQTDRTTFNLYKDSLTFEYYKEIAEGKARLPLLSYTRKEIEYVYNPFRILEQGNNATPRSEQYAMLTFFTHKGLPSHYTLDVRDTTNTLYKITNSTLWNKDVFHSSPKLSEPQLSLLLRLAQEAEALLNKLTRVYEEYVANMHSTSRQEVEASIKAVEDITNTMTELREEKALWAQVPAKSQRSFVNLLVSGPTKSDKRPLERTLGAIGNKAYADFNTKWSKLAGDVARDPRLNNP